MTRIDLDFMIDQAANEGWNPGLHDANTFYKTDHNGFFIAEIDGKPIGCISLVKYDVSFAFLGFFIVLPKYRGRGLGYQLWQHAMKYAGSSNVGLDIRSDHFLPIRLNRQTSFSKQQFHRFRWEKKFISIFLK